MPTDKRWGTLVAHKGRISVYHYPETGPHQFNVKVARYIGRREEGSGSLACVIDNAEVIGDHEAAISLTITEVDWLLKVQEKFDV